ncbi:MAG TPA: PD-(D/E)XK nuclease family protein [Acidimicrobiales bacterium]|jgi:RecB family exonuclease
MGGRVEWVGYGRPAAQALRSELVAAKATEPLSPVTVVVDSNHVGVATRRLLGAGALGPVAGGAGLAAVNFLTPYRLAELLGAAALARAGRRPISTPVVAAALRAALAEAPGVFAPVAQHPATERALIAAYRELRDLSEGSLAALAAAGPRAGDVVRLHRAARQRTAAAWYDEQDLAEAAAVAAGAGVAELGRLIVYLPQRLSLPASRLLARLSARSPLVVLAGTTGDPRADADVVRSVRRLVPDTGGGPGRVEPAGAAPDAGERAAPLALGRVMSVVGPERTRIVTASDSDDEVRAAVRAIVDAARRGAPLDKMAVLYAGPAPYARLLHEQLEAAGIAHNGSSVVALTARLAGRTLLGLLALSAGDFRRDDLFVWLAGSRVRRSNRPVPVARWERISRAAGVVAGADQWDRRLAAFAQRSAAEADLAAADPTAPPWRAERARADAASALELRGFVAGLIGELSRAAARPRRWADRSSWARRQLETLLGPDAEHADWPPVERRAVERVHRALDRLGGLDEVEAPVGLDAFTRTLEEELESDLGRVGRIGEGVLVGPIAMGVGLDLELVIVVGLAEGLFPSPTRDDSLLPDHERRVAGDELSLRAQGVERERRHLLAALAAGERHLLCVPRGDLRHSSERVPSRWVLEVAGALAGRPMRSADLAAAAAPWIEHVASFDAGLRRGAFPASEQEYRLRQLMARASGAPARTLPPGVADPVLVAGADALMARRSDRFTRFDGNLAGLPVPSPADRPTSATRLEGWAACPFAYLLRDVLGVQEVENPEDHLQITALDRGSLVHEVLERFVAESLALTPDRRPVAGAPWGPADRRRMVEVAEEVFADYEARGLTGRPLFWRRDRRRIVADLHRWLREDGEHRAFHRTRPIAAELAFGLPGTELGPVALRLADGRQVRFRGKADRLDVDPDGRLHVVDYKTGSTRDYAGLSETDPDLGGRRLQLAVYGQAARQSRGDPTAPVAAEYWFVSTAGKFERVGYPVTPEVLERVGQTLATVVRGIEQGVFPSHPSASSTTPWIECPYCDPDGLGVVELRDQFERKAADRSMAPFVELIGSPADEPAEPEPAEPSESQRASR